VAFALNDPKKVSNIVETEYGFHIIQLIETPRRYGQFPAYTAETKSASGVA